MKASLDKKSIRKIAKEQIEKGVPKQQVYNELVEQFKFRNDIAKIVREIPSNERWSKYGFLNVVLLLLVCILTIFSLIKPNFGIIWMFWIVYIVAFRKFNYYYWNTLLGAIGLITTIGLNLIEQKIAILESGIIVLTSLLFVIAGIYLPKILTPSFSEVKESYLNSKGIKKIRVVHKFEE